MSKVNRLIKDVIVERGIADLQGNVLDINTAQIEQVPGMEGWVLLTHNFIPDLVLGAAFVFINNGVFSAHIKIECEQDVFDKIKDKPLWPALGFKFEGSCVKDGKITNAIITRMALSNTPNIDPEIKPIQLSQF